MFYPKNKVIFASLLRHVDNLGTRFYHTFKTLHLGTGIGEILYQCGLYLHIAHSYFGVFEWDSSDER